MHWVTQMNESEKIAGNRCPVGRAPGVQEIMRVLQDYGVDTHDPSNAGKRGVSIALGPERSIG